MLCYIFDQYDIEALTLLLHLIVDIVLSLPVNWSFLITAASRSQVRHHPLLVVITTCGGIRYIVSLLNKVRIVLLLLLMLRSES